MTDLVQYTAQFGLALDDLTPQRVAMFVAARNAAPWVEEMVVPVAHDERRSDEPSLAEKETERYHELTAYQDEAEGARLPADEMDVALTGDAEDLPRVFPAQWLLEETQPDLFYARLAQGELLVPLWQRPTQQPDDAEDEIRQRELVEDDLQARAQRQHAYVLLDTSRTMNDHDRRGPVARGLALAFLLKGHQQRARLHLRPFTAEVGELSSGTGHEAFRAIAARVLSLPNAGQTRIQTALEQAVADIAAGGPCLRSEIMLITDGLSRIAECPLRGQKLHTFLIGDLLEKGETARTIETLKGWSETFHRVWTNRFADILAPTLADLEAAGGVLQALAEKAGRHPSRELGTRLRRMRQAVGYLLRQFQASRSKREPLPDEIAGLQAQLAATAPLLEACSEEALASALPTQPASSSLHAAGSSGAIGSGPGLWQRLKALAAAVAAWVRRALRRR